MGGGVVVSWAMVESFDLIVGEWVGVFCHSNIPRKN